MQLLPLIERALSEASLQNGPLFYLLTDMLLSWERKAAVSGEGEAPGASENFQSLLEDFWEDLGLLCVRYVDDEQADPRRLEGLAFLLQVSLSSLPSNVVHRSLFLNPRFCPGDAFSRNDEDQTHAKEKIHPDLLFQVGKSRDNRGGRREEARSGDAGHHERERHRGAAGWSL